MDKTKTILVADDDGGIRLFLKAFLEKMGFVVALASDGAEALGVLERTPVHLILSDQSMPRMDGLEFLEAVRTRYPSIPFIMVTGVGSIENAVKSMKMGANDYIKKPIDHDELFAVITRALEYSRVEIENRMLRDRLEEMFSFNRIVTRSPAMKKALDLARKVSSTPDSTVALLGESGTGKEVLAQAIHVASGRHAERFVVVNCAAIPETMLDSELFGHVKGAFTGADRDREGRFELARNGTVLLDEIGDMKLELQAKLLRVLQERAFERIGSNKKINANFRAIIATHRDLEALVRESRFREDLYYRIHIFPIFIPPLRERMEDIPLLSDYFIGLFQKALGKRLRGISGDAMQALMEYDWPGNVRELKNCIERAAILVGDEPIRPEHLIITRGAPGVIGEAGDRPGKPMIEIDFEDERFSMDYINNRLLAMALDRAGGNKSRAAEMLRVDRKMFYRHGLVNGHIDT